MGVRWGRAVPSAVALGVRWGSGYSRIGFDLRYSVTFAVQCSGAERTISFRARGSPFPLRSSAFIFGLSAGTGPDGALADPPAAPFSPFELSAASAKPLPLPETDATVAACTHPWLHFG